MTSKRLASRRWWGPARNTSGLGQNTSELSQNTSGLGQNTTGLSQNTSGLGQNTTGLSQNTSELSQLGAGPCGAELVLGAPRVAYAAAGAATGTGSTSTASSHQSAPCVNGRLSYEQAEAT